MGTPKTNLENIKIILVYETIREQWSQARLDELTSRERSPLSVSRVLVGLDAGRAEGCEDPDHCRVEMELGEILEVLEIVGVSWCLKDCHIY